MEHTSKLVVHPDSKVEQSNMRLGQNGREDAALGFEVWDKLVWKEVPAQTS